MAFSLYPGNDLRDSQRGISFYLSNNDGCLLCSNREYWSFLTREPFESAFHYVWLTGSVGPPVLHRMPLERFLSKYKIMLTSYLSFSWRVDNLDISELEPVTDTIILSQLRPHIVRIIPDVDLELDEISELVQLLS